MFKLVQRALMSLGVGEGGLPLATTIVGALVIIAIAFVATSLARSLLLRLVKAFAGKTKHRWDDALVEAMFFDRLARLAPAMAVHYLAPDIFQLQPALVTFLQSGAVIYMIVVGITAIDALLNASQEIYRTYEVSKSFPITSFLQVFKVVVYFLGGVLIISVVLQKSPAGLLTGLGALSAVTMLVFKDAILGFVAGIQLSANRVGARGDWIEVPSQGIDGDVLEVGLTTVKIRNFDKTITTLPTHALIIGSFKNWRGMSESGGRRIKRSLSIDMNTVKFCDEETLTRFKKIQFISEYIAKKDREIADFNKASKVDSTSIVNGRRLTNLGTFRAYIEAYLGNHPQISKDLTFLVRQLKPTAEGIPIEIYIFSTEQRWVPYEAVVADIFDHLLAVVPEFDLRTFQSPTGNDMREFGGSGPR
ncbi:MAG: mechanosensitive ion channel family protein [Verrucomicrobiia bacterium]